MVVERLKLYHKARDLKGLAKFNLMDRVYFTHEGKQITGIIMKLNPALSSHGYTVKVVSFVERLRLRLLRRTSVVRRKYGASRRSVTVKTGDGRQWNVSPSFLTQVTV